MSEMLRGFTPMLVRFTGRGAPVVFTPWFPKETDNGDTKAIEVVVPVPLNGTISGLFGSLLRIVSDPVLAPAAVGLNVTVNVQVAAVAIGEPSHVLVGKAKSPDVARMVSLIS